MDSTLRPPTPIDPSDFALRPDGGYTEGQAEWRGDNRGAPAVSVDPDDWYTPEEIAGWAAPLIPLDVGDDDKAAAMSARYIERASDPLRKLNVGRALAAWGWHKGEDGKSFDLPPGWTIGLGAVSMVGVGILVRGEFDEPIRPPAGLMSWMRRAGWRAMLANLNPLNWFRRGGGGARSTGGYRSAPAGEEG
jgi:hypothetical protein